MEQKPNLLEQAFDRLSCFPYLNVRRLMTGLWASSTAFLGFALLLEGVAVLRGEMTFRPEWGKNFAMWVGVNPVFAYTLYLWKKRDAQRDSAK